MSGKHGAEIRGLMSTKSSPLFQGRFGRMFRSLPAARFGASDTENTDNLRKLGTAMSATVEAAKDGKDEEESGIPSLYTYLGQFIDHDLTFDPMSTLQKQADPDALTDFRTPAFDLDSVYGRGPDDQPYLYDGAGSFLLGEALSGGGDANARDLPRNNPNPTNDPSNQNPARALIGDPRNDENVIVSQLQGLFLRFHNRTVKDNPGLDFAEVQKRVRFHYQFVVLNDFLPRVVHSGVLAQLKSGTRYDKDKIKFFHWRNDPFMPVEFSAAAYRLGHSMVRPGYRVNDQFLLPIFPIADFPQGLTGFQKMNPKFGIDWGRFIDVDVRTYDGSDADNKKRLQLAYRLDTSIVGALANLPAAVAQNPASLPQRNLLRGWRLGLPSGQNAAKAMGVKPLEDKDILIGKATGVAGDVMSIVDPKLGLPKVFAGNCPLWTYILAEAMQKENQEKVTLPVKEGITMDTPRLGKVGGRILAEVFLGLMFGDKSSMLSLEPTWQPKSGPDYKLKDFVNYALGN
jgi:hypothetical protein